MRLEEVVEELHVELIVLDDQNRFTHNVTPSPEGHSSFRQQADSRPRNPHINPALPKLKVNSKNFIKSSRSAIPTHRERAKAFAIKALLYLANDEEEMRRFLTETGFDPADLRRMASDPGFAGAMLDYLCSKESLLMAFAEAQGVDPSAVENARQYLANHA
jgi:hypothetical protein